MIRPIDLQTMYMNLDKVGKEQSVVKEQTQHQQTAQVERLHKEHDAQSHAVIKTPAGAEAEGKEANTIRPDQQEKKSGRRTGKKKAVEVTEEDLSDEKNDNEWTDPQLGRHIDVSG